MRLTAGMRTSSAILVTTWTGPTGRSPSASGHSLGVDVKYSIPLDRSFENLDVGQRTWMFRFIYVKGMMFRLIYGKGVVPEVSTS